MNKIKLEHILKIVSDVVDFPVDVIKAKNRKGELVRARDLYFYFARKYTIKTLYDISDLVDLDYSTVIHGTKTFYKDFDSNYLDTVENHDLIKIRIDNFIKSLNVTIFCDTSSIEIKTTNILEL